MPRSRIRCLLLAGLGCLLPAPAAAAAPGGAEVLFPAYSTLGTALARDAGGRILVGGDTGAGSGFAVVRLSPRGRLDRSFGTGGIARIAIGKSDFGDLTSVLALPDGRILASGTVGADGSQNGGYGSLVGTA